MGCASWCRPLLRNALVIGEKRSTDKEGAYHGYTQEKGYDMFLHIICSRLHRTPRVTIAYSLA